MKRLKLLQRPRFARRILEVGGGHDPYEGITHAVDKFPDNDAQRAARLKIQLGVEFRQGDLEAIPFEADPKFDFIYVSHVLEHVRNPQNAIAEINRVADRGYLETPSPLREQLACPIPFDSERDFHLSFCWMEPSTRTFNLIWKSEGTIGQFCECPDGKLAHSLFRLVREKRVDLEPLLPRDAKSSRLAFDGKVSLRVHQDFASACATGACAYRSAHEVRRWTRLPWRWAASRLGSLRDLLRGNRIPLG